MIKQVHTILCWILTISLVWLPLTVSADISLSLINKDSCHEMNTTRPMSMPDHDMSVRSRSSHSQSRHSMHSVMSAQTTGFDDSIMDNAFHTSMQQIACCDQCNDDCAGCAGMTSCGHSLKHVSAFILFKQYASQSLSRIQFSIEQFTQYHNQIITPDFRPPIV